MKVLNSLIIILLTAQTGFAAIITWGSPTLVSTESDVSTNGILEQAVNCAADTIENNVTVNGVVFEPGDFLDESNNGDLFIGATTGSADYDQLLSNFDLGGGTDVTISIGDGNLVAGDFYEVQVWFVDTRLSGNPSNDTRVMTIGDGEGNNVDLNDEFAIGTFTADGTDQPLQLITNNFSNAHITAFQVRKVVSNPEVEISTASDTVTTAFTVDVLFSEDVTGLDASDFVVVNGAASNVLPAVGPASSYSVTITPTGSGLVTVSLAEGAADDSELDPSLASNVLTTIFVPSGSEQATVTLSTLEETNLVLGPYIIDIVFDEDVEGLDVDDFQIVNGTVSDVLPETGPASTFTATITPTVIGDVAVTLLGAGVLDLDDALPALDSNTLVTDFVQPLIPIVVLSNPSSGAVVTGPYTVGITFAEDVSGLAITDFTVSNGVASNLVMTDAANYTLDITPAATGVVSVVLLADSVTNVDGELLGNPEALVQANSLPESTGVSGCLDLSPGSALLGAGESNGLFASPRTFDSVSDSSLNDIAWTDGVNSGTFDLSFVATSSLAQILRGFNGAFGTAEDEDSSALIDEGESITLGSLVASDLTGDLAGGSLNNIQLIGVYLGNETVGDGATINGVVAFGAAGPTNELMRNAIEQSPTAVIVSTGGDGFSVNGIEVSFDVDLGLGVQVVSCEFNDSNGFDVTFSGLIVGTTYELHFSPDLESPFTPVANTTQEATSTQDTFTDVAPPLPGNGFYQLFVSP